MKFSIITPTHNPKYIFDLWESIKNQTFTDWEWLIIANNGAKVEIEDDRVKIINCPFNLKSVGFLKKYGFMQASGDIIVEVDHDDLLTPDCLEELAKAFEDKEIGFAYSNNAKLTDNFIPYGNEYGWKSRLFNWKGKDYYEMVSFEPTSHSFTFIWYEPDHVRAWRAQVYKEIGGHDENLDVLDDQDLLIRTYLKTKIKHIDKCLYLYRITGENTWIERNQKIQTETVNIYHKYAYQLAERHAELNNLAKIDLGGGFGKPDGYTSIDLKNGDIKADLTKKWSLSDNSVGIIRAHDIFEHLPDKQHTMSECWRVLADGGWLMVQVPSTSGKGAFQDPTHVSYWNDNAFWYWTRKEQAQYIHNDKIKFQAFRLEEIYPNEYCKQNNIIYTVAYLSAIKSDKRRPHLINI
jgi:glycosyltransferase involved in cell wall biosynthesis